MVEVQTKADDIDWGKDVLTRADRYVIAVRNVDTGKMEAYQIDLGEVNYREKVDPLMELLATYGQRVEVPILGIEESHTPAIEPPKEPENPKKPVHVKAIPEPRFSNPDAPQVPFTKEDVPSAPVLAGTTRVDSEDARDAVKNTGKLPLKAPEWVWDVKAICQLPTPSGPCGAKVVYKTRYQHAKVHDMEMADIKWTLTGMPVGESERVCGGCRLNFPHELSLYYHERVCPKRGSIPAS